MADDPLLDAYLAGIFDGEGSVGIQLNKKNFISVGVRVSMCDPEPIDALAGRFGGTRRISSRKSYTGRDVHIWGIHNGLAVEALSMFAARCLNKKRAAQLALEIAIDMARNPAGPGLPLAKRERRLILLREFMNLPNRRLGSPREPDPVMAAKYLAPRTYGALQVRPEDGEVFLNQSEAGRAMGVSSCAISYAIRKNGTSCGYKWTFVDGD